MFFIMSLLRSFLLTKCSVSIVDTSNVRYSNTARWTRTPPISRWPATSSMIKVEWHGDGFVGLCSKTYYSFGTASNKCTTKDLNKHQNAIDKDTFLAVLTHRRSGSGINRGFRVHNASMMTYVQERAALAYFYPKRKVLADGLSTAPLDL